MEHLKFDFAGEHAPQNFKAILVGVVGSGNLEVLMEPGADPAHCTISITT